MQLWATPRRARGVAGLLRGPPAPPPPVTDPRPPQAMLCLSSQRYLRARPSVRLLLRGFLRELLLQRPDDVLEFAAAYFTQPELPGQIQEELGRPRAVP
ncbi:RIIa domain-containing protein 1 [Accipiter gentilis]|uniref:RIIa domain-containing protein 1 n=1 Tax=Astur gentilis TaxID=8957 RepID=UPI00210FF2FB|nr:RIIa domain-containing protein 1 [Accipiter gentilis]